jgi:hypothetical protein
VISTNDIHWAAGFLDGEGWFTHCRDKPVVGAGQKYPPSLEKLQRIFKYGKVLRRLHQELFVWQITGHKAIAVMMTIYPLMSPYRQSRIREILSGYKHSQRRAYLPHGYVHRSGGGVERKTK